MSVLARCTRLDQVIGFNIFEEGFYQLINYWFKNGTPLFIEELLINVNNRPLDNPDEPWIFQMIWKNLIQSIFGIKSLR